MNASAPPSPPPPSRLTPQVIEGLIASEWFQIVPDTSLTLCALTLRNGFTVVGQSAHLDPLRFDPHMGRLLARDDALRKLHEMHAYAVKEFGHALLDVSR